MKHKVLIFDIETGPTQDPELRERIRAANQAKLDKIRERAYWQRVMEWDDHDLTNGDKAVELWLQRLITLNPHTAVMACGCFKDVATGEITQCMGPDGVISHLRDLAESPVTFVTYNGTRYDWPVVLSTLLRPGTRDDGLVRSLNRRLQAPHVPGLYPFHIDLCALLTEKLGDRMISLDDALMIYTQGGGKNTAGPKFFAEATPAQLLEHCAGDMKYTLRLLRALSPLLPWTTVQQALRSTPEFD